MSFRLLPYIVGYDNILDINCNTGIFMLAHKGKLYARVSDILKPFVNFDGISQEVLQAKALVGTMVHDCIEKIVKGEPYPTIGVRKCDGYIESFKCWMRALNPTFLKSEERYYCDEMLITGQVDSIVKLEGEEKCLLVDFKTSVQESPTWIMQAHLYYYLISKNSSNLDLSKRFLFLKLDRYGQLPIVFEYHFDDRMNQRCMQAVKDYWNRVNVDVIS